MQLVQAVADRYLVRRACLEALAEHRVRTASMGLTAQTLEAFATAFYLPYQRGKVAFGQLLRRLKDLVVQFTKAPMVWEKFKQLLGVKDLTDLPGLVRDLAKRGYGALRGLVVKAFSKFPLKIYTLEHSKLLSLNALIEKLLKKFPRFHNWIITKAKPRVDQFDQWLKEHLPGVSTVLLVAVYFFIWFNVQEFEWDLKGLMDALTGAISLSDLLLSLPSSALGLLLNSLGLGTFSLLPVAFIARLVVLLAARYLEWTGKGFRFNRKQWETDFGVPAEALPEAM